MKAKGERIKVSEAAEILGVGPQFVRVGLQTKTLPVGVALKMSTHWCYHISKPMLAAYSGKDLETELEKIRYREVGERCG